MAEQLGQFKSQPWIVFDTVASRSYLLGENRSDFFAFGTAGPAITQAGEMLFFSAVPREPVSPWYTSTELVGQLSYGFEAWQVYVAFNMPPFPGRADGEPADGGFGERSPVSALTQTIINFSVLQLTLGQEEQMSWPLIRFGSGGGFFMTGGVGASSVQNGWPQEGNVIALPDPVMIARTQNIDAKILIAPEAQPIIGTNALPGVGTNLGNITIQIDDLVVPTTAEVPELPFTTQVGLIGKRVKKTQYGQVA